MKKSQIKRQGKPSGFESQRNRNQEAGNKAPGEEKGKGEKAVSKSIKRQKLRS